MTDYKPIACSLYDVIEAAAVRRAALDVRIKNEFGESELTLTVLDLFSRDKQEFLKAEDRSTGKEIILRLDQVLLLTDRATGKEYSS